MFPSKWNLIQWWTYMCTALDEFSFNMCFSLNWVFTVIFVAIIYPTKQQALPPLLTLPSSLFPGSSTNYPHSSSVLLSHFSLFTTYIFSCMCIAPMYLLNQFLFVNYFVINFIFKFSHSMFMPVTSHTVFMHWNPYTIFLSKFKGWNSE